MTFGMKGKTCNVRIDLRVSISEERNEYGSMGQRIRRAEWFAALEFTLRRREGESQECKETH